LLRIEKDAPDFFIRLISKILFNGRSKGELSLSPPSDESGVLARRIAGEIILSDEHGAVMRKWREKFSISQTVLARELGLSPSVISDYESGRRKNPGVHFVKRFVQVLLKIEKERGKHLGPEFSELPVYLEAAVLDMDEFSVPVGIKRFNRAVSGQILTHPKLTKKISGYTVINNEIAITKLSGRSFLQIFGKTAERALVFTNIKPERAPMLALRFSLLKPVVVVYHLSPPEELDIELAESDGITLIHSKARSIENLLRSLRKLSTAMADESSGS